jgi:hypothetical protein
LPYLPDIYYYSKLLSQIRPIPLREPLIFGGSPSLKIYFSIIFQVQWSSFPLNILLLGQISSLIFYYLVNFFFFIFHVLRFANPIGQVSISFSQFVTNCQFSLFIAVMSHGECNETNLQQEVRNIPQTTPSSFTK